VHHIRFSLHSNFHPIPSGDEDSNSNVEDKRSGLGSVFMSVKFGMTLLRKIQQNDEKDEVADALDSGRRNLDRARSTEQTISTDP
jgi:hypothetical protein